MNIIGIDISKEKLDIFVNKNNKSHCIPNKDANIEKIFHKIDRKDCLVVLENTGGYEDLCVEKLHKMGFAIHKTDNAKVKNFIRSLGRAAKTDAIDAKFLAKYGEERQKDLPILEVESEETLKIKALTRYLTGLKDARAKEKLKLQSPGCARILEAVQGTIALLSEQIKKIEKELKELIELDEKMEEKISIMTEYKGIGTTSALQLLTHMPELGKLNRRQVAALAGVAPFNNDSGKKNGYRTTRGSGRGAVKRILFMAAMTAIRYNDFISRFYNRLVERGKKKMVAIVACMRKIIIYLNFMLQHDYFKKKA